MIRSTHIILEPNTQARVQLEKTVALSRCLLTDSAHARHNPSSCIIVQAHFRRAFPRLPSNS